MPWPRMRRPRRSRRLPHLAPPRRAGRTRWFRRPAVLVTAVAAAAALVVGGITVPLLITAPASSRTCSRRSPSASDAQTVTAEVANGGIGHGRSASWVVRRSSWRARRRSTTRATTSCGSWKRRRHAFGRSRAGRRFLGDARQELAGEMQRATSSASPSSRRAVPRADWATSILAVPTARCSGASPLSNQGLRRTKQERLSRIMSVTDVADGAPRPHGPHRFLDLREPPDARGPDSLI